MQNEDDNTISMRVRRGLTQLLLWASVILGALLAYVVIAIIFRDTFGIELWNSF